MADGIEPDNALELRSIRTRLRKLPSSDSIVPESRLEEMSSDASCERFPTSLGIEPRMFELAEKSIRIDNFPISEGNTEKRLSDKLSSLNAVSKPISVGIGPVKEFL
jgi:hypothetical protein